MHPSKKVRFNDEVPKKTIPSLPIPVAPRRSSRTSKPVKKYDAHTGNGINVDHGPRMNFHGLGIKVGLSKRYHILRKLLEFESSKTPKAHSIVDVMNQSISQPTGLGAWKTKGYNCQHCSGQDDLHHISNGKGFICKKCIDAKGMTKNREPLEDYELNPIDGSNPKTKHLHEDLTKDKLHEEYSKLNWSNSWDDFEKGQPLSLKKGFAEYASNHYLADDGDSWSSYKMNQLTALLGYLTLSQDHLKHPPPILLSNLHSLINNYLSTKSESQLEHDKILDLENFSSFTKLREYITQFPGILKKIRLEK